MMTRNKQKQEIFTRIKRYHEQSERNRRFIPGKTKVRYAGAFYDHAELTSMIDTMLDGWFGLGLKGEKLETAFTRFIGSNSTLLTNSGSSASLLSMAALTSDLYHDRIEKGSHIITPACTFATTVAAIVHQGLVPVFVDVELGTYNINPQKLADAITKKTRAIFIPHTLGNPNDMDIIMKVAKKHNLHVVEDNCDALGSEYNGRKTGSFGVLATCSFYPAHHMTMAGEGGAVFINDPRLYRTVLAYRNWGRGCWCTSLEKNPDGACRNRFNFTIDGIPVDHKYYFVTLGYNLKPVEIQAAMGLAQLARFPTMVNLRRKNFAVYGKFFKPYERFFVLPLSLEKANPCWFSFPLTIRNGSPFTRKEITSYLEKHLVETRTVFAGNITRHPAMRRVNYLVKGKLVNSDKILKDTFFIGIWPGLGKAELGYTMTVFDKFLKRY